MTSLSNYPHVRPVLTANAFRRRQLGKQLQRKAMMHGLTAVPLALLALVFFRTPLGLGAAGLLCTFAGWRYIVTRRRMDFLREAPITLGESVVRQFRFKRSVYRIAMSYTFEGRSYSHSRAIEQADHAAVLSREISLYAVFDCRNPGRMLGYRAGSVIPRWLKSRSEEGAACERLDQRFPLTQLGAEEREEVGADR